MALIVILLLSAALSSGQLLDDLDTLEMECLGEDVFQCANGGCVPREKYCDGYVDCPDATDEDFCLEHFPDPSRCNQTNYHYLCEDRERCIPISWLCNNETECNDGSDEKNCTQFKEPESNSTCKGFICDGDKCISTLWLCDGVYDCEDKSDEHSEDICRRTLLSHTLHDATNCFDTPETVPNYRCIDSSFCLPKQFMCNGINDCRDGSDEGSFCAHWNTMCLKDKHPCKGNHTKCQPERYGPHCICAEAPTLKQYNYLTGLCEDVDECAQARPQCSHMCENSDGRFQCHCDDGYSADTYAYLCYANGPEAMLFFTTKNEIRYVKIKSKQEVVVETGLKQAHGVTFDGKYLYWVETAQGHQAIIRAHLEDVKNTQEVIVSLGLEDPGDLALDWVGGHIYFSDVHRGSISVCLTDGSICTTLHTNAKQPRFVTLDVRNGKMYWADWHHRPLIMAANMDGSGPQELVDSLSTYATGLTMDAPNGRLYFVDKTIRVFKLDDKQTYSLFEEPFHHPYAVAVFENTVFWSDWTSNSIQTTDKLHGTRQKRFMLTAQDSPVYDMHVYHPVLLNEVDNPCDNMTCSHLCLLASNVTAVCACPDGMALRGSTCQHIDGYRPLYLVVGGGSLFTKVDYNSLGNPETHATSFDISRVQAMAYDSTRDTLYIYDGQRKSLYFVNMTDFSLGIPHLLLYRGLENVVDMDYDYMSDSLYLADAGRGFIEVISLRTQQRAMITRFRDQEVPISICVMPDYGRMLVAVMETERGNSVRIVSIGLDGDDRKNIIMNDLQGPKISLRYDQNMDVVYVGDEGNSLIDVIHPEGTGRENFRDLSTTVTNVAVTDTYVFWTDRRTRLYWSNVHEATHYIRKMEFSIFPNNSQLHIQATSPPPDPQNLIHPCVTTLPCSHVCVQSAHPPLSLHDKSRAKISAKSLGYKCLCPPGLFIIDGRCNPLAQCKENELYCHKSNVCFPKGKYCDGIRDCTDGEDEEGCEDSKEIEPTGCSKGYKLCYHICIENSEYCGEDEATTSRTTTVAPTGCENAEFQCTNSTICIERSQVCDGKPDCLNGSDEATSLCDVFACRSYEFMCTVGSCILKAFRCDGEDDCADGSDEVDCGDKSCGLGYYQCRNSQCIELRKRCDGRQDCLDVSDEEDCGEPTLPTSAPVEVPMSSCHEEQYNCELNRSICLPLTARCNMKVDCPGGTDESACDYRCSRHGKFECAQEFICVDLDKLCDGNKDCLDGSDETPEACSKVKKQSVVYPPVLRPSTECRDGYLCNNGQCMEWRQVCNDRIDCYDGSDENGLCPTACVNHTCAFSCQPTPRGAHCQCVPGYRAAPGTDLCVDVDECAEHMCAQECHNMPGSFLCTCFHGYARRPDGRSCKATSGDLSILYMSGNTVWSIAADGKGSVLYNDPKNAAIADIDVDVRKNKLFISLTEAGQLLELNSSTSDVTVTNIGRPTKVAVDWITGNVYFVDVTPSAHCIRACHVGRKRCAKLQKLPGVSKVTALAVDPPSGLMFYCTTRDAKSLVWSASLAGLRVADLSSARNCSGLAIDSFRKLVYVAETNPPRVFRMDFNGENQQSVLAEQLQHQAPHGLALFEDSAFFLVSNSLKLNRCSLFGRRHCEPFIYRVLGANTFVVRHESAQRDDRRDLCMQLPCANLCALDGERPVCVCDEGNLAVDGACRLLEKEQLPLFNGWTSEQYLRAQHATLTAVAAVLAMVALYLLVFLYYHFVHRPRAARAQNYLEVRFQNTESTSQAAIVELPQPTSSEGGHEFVNPLEYVRDLWEEVRRQKRPVGTAGLDINIPYEQHDLSDTESDLDERDTKSIIRK